MACFTFDLEMVSGKINSNEFLFFGWVGLS